MEDNEFDLVVEQKLGGEIKPNVDPHKDSKFQRLLLEEIERDVDDQKRSSIVAEVAHALEAPEK